MNDSASSSSDACGADSGHAALLFYWQAFERQIRVEGVVERVDAAASDAYFAVRPRASRIAGSTSRRASWRL